MEYATIIHMIYYNLTSIKKILYLSFLYPLCIFNVYLKKASIRVFCCSKTKTKYIENSFFCSKFYSRYTSPFSRSTRIDEFGIKKNQNAQRFFLYIILIITCTPIFSQSNQTSYVVKHYGIKEGLSANYTTSVVSDHHNIKWIATENGITKYNGYDFEYVLPNEKYKELKNENIETLFIDHNNNLWIGTKSGGLSVLNAERAIIKNYNHLINKGNKNDQRIISLTQENNGNIWVGTWLDGIFVINPEEHKLIRHIQSTCVMYTMTKDQQGNIWYGNYDILTKYDPVTQETSEFPIKIEITDLIDDPKRNKIWIGTAGVYNPYIYSYDKTSKQIDSIWAGTQSGFARHLALDKENRMWIGTHNHGLYVSDSNLKNFKKVNIQKEKSRKRNINYDIITDIHVDHNNMIWVSSPTGGLIQLIPGKAFNNAYQLIQNEKLQHDFNIQSICKDSKNLWIGSLGNGVFIGSNFSTLATKTSKNHKRAIYKYGEQIFIGFDFSFDIYNSNSGERVYENTELERINSFLVDSKKRLWIGTQHNGVYCVPLNQIVNSGQYINFHDGGSGNLKLDNIDRITDIKEDHQGNVWVGTFNGLHLYDEKSKSFIHHSNLMKEKLPGVIINCIFFDQNEMWIGTPNGLVELQYLKNILSIKKIYGEDDGINNSFISSITSDKNNNFWISTATEIMKFDKAKKTFINYGETDGIKTSSFNSRSVFNDGQYIYFGGIDNITFFNPEEIENHKNDAEIILSKLIIDNQEIAARDTINNHVILRKDITYNKEITLSHRERSVQLSFVLNDHLGKSNVNYRYKLLGFRDEWVELNDNNQINFTGLPSGDYTLQIIGSRNNQAWTPPKVIRLIIKPAPWLSIWAYLLYFLIFLSIVIFFVRMRIKQSKLQNIVEISKIEKEKETELTEAKLSFFTNISHEFRTPLTLIISPLTEIIEYKNLDNSIKNKLKVMNNNAHRLLNLVNQLLSFRKADRDMLTLNVSEGDFVAFAYNTFSYFKEMAISKEIDYTFESNLDHISFLFDRNHMEIVLSNLLSNAFKHTQSGDSIALKINTEKNRCFITVKDTGIGIPEDKLDKIFDQFYQVGTTETVEMMGSGIGLAFSKKIIVLHHGTINVTSEIHKSTVFTITLPMDYDYASSLDDAVNGNFSVGESKKEHKSSDSELVPLEDSSKITVLLVEDNQEIRNYLKDLLSAQYVILEAENGVTGLEVATDEIPDIIISDIMMPIKDGISLCKELKAQITTSHIPIILLTAKSSITSEIEGIQTGADDYITKPFNPFVVKAKVASILENRKKLRHHLYNKVRFEPDTQEIEIDTVENQFINQAIQLVEKNLQNPEFGIPLMTTELMMSQSSLYRKIKSLTGLSLSAFIRSVRLKNAAKMIINTDAKLNQIAYEVGFNDYKYFKKSFEEHFGCLPSVYKKQKK
ncbi:two-component regulator propeller domain-containing protein [Aquimarina sp. MMG016]|uniref:hybrid sensor histidine kinase/response regulator transcription factor n=1 Tax=Aquimarina sp. MMG016 TaxID=2822690 RepID=UPI001B3A36F2|nr:two-component regulator propeller domain-containing protein [Aquimarina sp. MMG016]MBQ4822718.1 response regulator [Aquimarina sp. MMG016]